MIAAVVWEDDDSFSGQSVCLKNSQQVIVWLFIAVMPDAVILWMCLAEAVLCLTVSLYPIC